MGEKRRRRVRWLEICFKRAPHHFELLIIFEEDVNSDQNIVVAFYTVYAGVLCYAMERSYFWGMGRAEMFYEAKRAKEAREAQEKA